jgi:hypothetical protein
LISLCVALAAIPIAILLLSKSNTYFRPEIALPTVLIIGVTAVLGVLGSIALAFYPQLRAPQQYTLGPLGLPDGTIGAVISLMLLIIFATTSLYLFASLTEGSDSNLIKGISAADIEEIPTEQLLSVVQNKADPSKFDVKRITPNRAGEEFAKQILSVVGTLLVAIVGFYFGSHVAGPTPGPGGPTMAAPSHPTRAEAPEPMATEATSETPPAKAGRRGVPGLLPFRRSRRERP